jgi:hypothetical protein
LGKDCLINSLDNRNRNCSRQEKERGSMYNTRFYIVNVSSIFRRKFTILPENLIYVGRGCNPEGWQELHFAKSPLSNPFKIGKDGDRRTVILLYKQWLFEKMCMNDPAVMWELYRIASHREVILACHCAPKLCHASIIRDACDWYFHHTPLFRTKKFNAYINSKNL